MEVTPHSFVRSPDLRASTEGETERRDRDVTMVGNEKRGGGNQQLWGRTCSLP
jgi:hypothetical protein